MITESETMTDLPETNCLITELDKGWLTIWLNRPEVRNAMSRELSDELLAVLSAIRDDRTVRGVTIRGKGGAFCAGGDLKEFKANFQSGDQKPEEVAAYSQEIGSMFEALSTLPMPVIMLVEGPAMAGGFGIVCTGDVVIVTEDAKFAMTETAIGIPPAQIIPHVAARLGMAVARRLTMTAARIDSAEALQVGLADYVLPDIAAAEALEAEFRSRVMRCAPGANAASKEILHATRNLQGQAMVDFAAKGFADAIIGPEGREGIASFLEKRKPVWANED